MSKVLIEITATQSIDDQSDKIELTTVGKLSESADAYVVNYEEQQEPPYSSIAVTVIVRKNNCEAEVTRKGNVGTCLNMKKSGRVQCHYATEYGNILMGITTHTIDTNICDGEGYIYLAYDIDVNGALASVNDIRLTMKKIQEN